MLNISLQFFAHKKGMGSTKNGRDSESKRLGPKRADGQFVLAGNILARYHTYSSYDVHGLRWTMPVTGALWMGGFLAIVGSPPFGLFVSEFLILKGILQQGQWLVAALYMLALAIIFVGMSVAVLRMFQGTRPTDMPECPRESALSVLPPMALGLCVLLLGFWMPDGVEKLLRASAALIGG